MSFVRRTAASGACLLAVTLPVTSASASPPPVLRVVGTTASALQANVVVAVPPELANTALPTSAFGMQQDGRPIPVKVQRVSTAGLDVYVVVDTAGTNTAVVWHKSAAADLLRLLPASARTSVATATGDVPVPQQGNVAALRALAAVQPRSDAVVDTTLNRIATAANSGRKRLIVLMTSCPQDSSTDLRPLQAALASGTSQLDVVGFGSGCRSRLLPLAHDRGGLTLSAARPTQLAEAVDTIVYDALGQYWLSVPAPAKAISVVVTVDFAGVHAANELRLPTATTGRTTTVAVNPYASASVVPAAGSSANDSSEWRLRALLAAAAACILIAELVAALRVTAGRRPRRRPSNAAKPGGWRNPAARAPRGRAKQPAPTPWVVTGAVASVTLADSPAETTPPPAPETGTATGEPLRDERTSSDLELEPIGAAGEPRGRPLTLPPSGLSDGDVRVRLPGAEDARALQDFAESDGGLAGMWAPPPGRGTGADDVAVIDSWSRTWGGEHPAGWSWPSSSSAGRESSSPADAAQPIAPPRPSGLGRGLGLVVDRAEEDGMIGYVGVQEKPHAVEVSFGTAPPYRGQDYTRRAVRLVADWLVQQEPVRQVQTVILPSDNVSRSVARDVGFVPTGTVWTFVPATGMMALSVCFVFEPASDMAELAAEQT